MSSPKKSSPAAAKRIATWAVSAVILASTLYWAWTQLRGTGQLQQSPSPSPEAPLFGKLESASDCPAVLEMLMETLGLRARLSSEVEWDSGKCHWLEGQLLSRSSEPSVVVLADRLSLSGGQGAPRKFHLEMTCKGQLLDAFLEPRGENLWRVDWKTEQWNSECLPAVGGTLKPRIRALFRSDGFIEIDAKILSRLKGEAKLELRGLVWNEKFLTSGGSVTVDIQDTHLTLRSAFQSRQPMTEEPRLAPGDSSGLQPFSMILNGEVQLPGSPYAKAAYHLRGRLRFPRSTPLTDVGLVNQIEDAYQEELGSYLVAIEGPLGAPKWRPLQKKD